MTDEKKGYYFVIMKYFNEEKFKHIYGEADVFSATGEADVFSATGEADVFTATRVGFFPEMYSKNKRRNLHEIYRKELYTHA